MKAYSTRSIRFLELYQQDDWTIKLYSISATKDLVASKFIASAKKELPEWLSKSQLTELKTYKMATLILHEGKEGCFALLNWWIDENMLQHFVYLAAKPETVFREYSSQNGIIACVWELSVLWFERDAWVKHVLMKNNKPDFHAYLNEQLNQD
jgi:hypothetical protein